MKPIDKLMERYTKYADRVHFTVGEKPKTNVDRIRNMTDEELAEWLEENTDCVRCLASDSGCCVNDNTCKNGWLKWLKQEVKEKRRNNNAY